MNIKDRTSEFQRSCITYKRLQNNKQHSNTIEQQFTDKSNNVSEFQRNASHIAKEISITAKLLSKLAIMAKRKPMFNDNPIEIAELSFLIKQKIYSIEQKLLQLSKLSNNPNSFKINNSNGNYKGNVNNKGTIKHSHNVVNLLNRKMKNMSGGFKDVLEERQRLEINNKDRWGKINDLRNNSNTDGKSHNNNNTHTNSVNTNNEKTDDIPEREVLGYNSANPFMSNLIQEEEQNQMIISNKNATNNYDMSLGVPNSDQQLLLMEEGLSDQNNIYLQERNRAVETIETTIQEVGNLFQQLASMVQEQGETIQRIDANVEDIDLNITGAQRELLKYFDNIKNNRWLAVKIFFIIFMFFLVWVLVN